MKRIISVILALVFVLVLFASCGKGSDVQTTDNNSGDTTQGGVNKSGKVADPAKAKEFTKQVRWVSEGIEFYAPEDYESNAFVDCGVRCMIMGERYDGNVSIYHEYDKDGEITKKTVGKYTFDYQSFDYLGLKDWHIFVIRIAFTESPNQMEHGYYKIVYNVYGENYPESQIEKFMATLSFPNEK